MGSCCPAPRGLISYVEMCILRDITVGKRHYTNKLKTKTGPGWRNPQGSAIKQTMGCFREEININAAYS